MSEKTEKVILEKQYDSNVPQFVCWWEDIIGLYTEEELYEQYKETNLYDDMEGILWVGYSTYADTVQFRFFDEVLCYLKDNEDLIRNTKFICDNMQIIRII